MPLEDASHYQTRGIRDRAGQHKTGTPSQNGVGIPGADTNTVVDSVEKASGVYMGKPTNYCILYINCSLWVECEK